MRVDFATHRVKKSRDIGRRFGPLARFVLVEGDVAGGIDADVVDRRVHRPLTSLLLLHQHEIWSRSKPGLRLFFASMPCFLRCSPLASSSADRRETCRPGCRGHRLQGVRFAAPEAAAQTSRRRCCEQVQKGCEGGILIYA